MSKHPFRMAVPGRAARIARRQRIRDGLQLAGLFAVPTLVGAILIMVHFL